MARYNYKQGGVNGWPIPNDGRLRVFATGELGMTNQQVNDDIQAANDDGIYPRVILHGSETLSVEIGTVVVRDDEGFWGFMSEEALEANFDEEHGPKAATPTTR